jgi:serine/threonine protein phosphatase PrpC
LTTLKPSHAERLVLCTDGLWNAAPAAEALAKLVEGLDAHATPASVAHHLADAAIAAGTRDDVTVAVIDIDREEGSQP